MITYSQILGSSAQPEYADQLHEMEHHGQVDYVTLSSDDIQRRRLKTTSYQGRECAIVLEREIHLYNGAILALDDRYALLVRSANTKWLRCLPSDSASALELGYFAGNMHWSVRFNGETLDIELKGKLEDYQNRLSLFTSTGRIKLMELDA